MVLPNTAFLGLLPMVIATPSQPVGAWFWSVESGPNSEQLEGEQRARGLGGAQAAWGQAPAALEMVGVTTRIL